MGSDSSDLTPAAEAAADPASDKPGRATSAAFVAELDRQLQHDLDPWTSLSQLHTGLADLLSDTDSLSFSRADPLVRAAPKLLLAVLRRNSEFDGQLAGKAQAVLELAAKLCASSTALRHPDMRETVARLFTESFYAKALQESSAWATRDVAPAAGAYTMPLLPAAAQAAAVGSASRMAPMHRPNPPPPSDDGSVSSVAVEESGDLDDYDNDDTLGFSDYHFSATRGQLQDPVQIMADTKIVSAAHDIDQDESPAATCILADDHDLDDMELISDSRQPAQPRGLHAVISSFASAGGFENIIALLNESSPCSVTFIRGLLKPVHRIRALNFLADSRSFVYITSVRQIVYRTLLAMSDDELKGQDKRALRDVLRMLLQLSENTGRIAPANSSDTDHHGLFELDFALKRLQSRFLEQRLIGVTDIRYHVNEAKIQDFSPPTVTGGPSATPPSSSRLRRAVSPAISDDGSSADGPTVPPRPTVDIHRLRVWLRHNCLIELLFDGDRLHPEVLKRSGDLLRFMGSQGMLDPNQISLIWNTTRGSHESVKSVVYSLIAELPTELALKDLETVWQKIASIPYDEFTQMEITLVANFTMNALQCPRVVSSLALFERTRTKIQDSKNESNRVESESALSNLEPAYPGLVGWFGLTTLWDLIQDDAGVQQTIFELALSMLRDFLVWSPCAPRRSFMVKQCVANISSHQSQTQSLQILRIVLFSFSKSASQGDQRPPDAVLRQLQIESKLLQIVFNDYEQYHDLACRSIQSTRRFTNGRDIDGALTIPGSRWHHLWNITERLEFLRSVCVPSLAPFLTIAMVDTVWNCSVREALSHDESKHALKWFEDVCPSLGSLEGRELINHVFDQRLKEIPATKLSLPGFYCFETYFREVNLQEQNLVNQAARPAPTFPNPPQGFSDVRGRPAVAVVSFELRGASKLWEIALESSDPTVAQCAAFSLQSFYHDLSHTLQNELGPRYRQFLQYCFDKVRQYLEDDARKEKQTVLRCVSLIRAFVDEFESRSAKEAHIFYQRHGLRGRGSPLTVAILPMGHQKFEIKTHSNESIWNLRGQIAQKLRATNQSLDEAQKCLRMITQGRELKDDQRTLGEIGINQSNQIQVTIGQRLDSDLLVPSGEFTGLAGDQAETIGNIVSLTKLDLSNYPTHLLSDSPYFDILLELLEVDDQIACVVWGLLMRLPTNPPMLEILLKPKAMTSWETYLTKKASYTLLYSLQIMDSLCNEKDYTSSGGPSAINEWQCSFEASGGLNDLTASLCSLLPLDGAVGVRKECVSLSVKILKSCTVLNDRPADLHPLGRKRPAFVRCPALLKGYDAAVDMGEKLLGLAIELAPSENRDQEPATDRTNAADDTAVDALALLVAICGINGYVVSRLVETSIFRAWIVEGLLTSSKQGMRSMTVQAVNWMLDHDHPRKTGEDFVFSLLNRVCMREFAGGLYSLEYFEVFLACTLPSRSPSKDFSGESMIRNTLRRLVQLILNTEAVESRKSDRPDTVLCGLLITTQRLASVDALDGQTKSLLVEELFENYLFGIPSPQGSRLPKCKTRQSRKRAFDLLLSIAKPDRVVLDDVNNRLVGLHEKVAADGSLSGSHPRGSWYYNPLLLEKSSCGYVGLKNLGTTCYMNAVLQQLFMIPKFRAEVLHATSNQTVGEPQALLKALQNIFGGLLVSAKKFYDTREFCSVYTDADGLKMNTAMQMDVDEFLNALFDKLERAVKGTPYEKLLTKRFGGKLLNQVVCQEVEYVSEREESFHVLSLDVKGKSSLEESLDFYVKGELLDGDNKYFCQPHNRHVVALKRTCLGSLPPTLIIHLKRFEFDFDQMRKVKLNDRCEFPTILDLEPYTKEAITRMDKAEEPPSKTGSGESHVYSLAGILVHSGTAESGHYYSFVKERSSGDSEWIQFNDIHTTRFDEQDIPNSCFGGNETVQQYDPIQQKQMQWWQAKQHSAYMLFYERCEHAEHRDSEMEVDTSPSEPADQSIPLEIFERLCKENEAFALDGHVFESDYGQFLRDLALPQLDTMPRCEPVNLAVLQYSTMYVVDCLSRTKDVENLRTWKADLESIFGRSRPAARWILERCVSSPEAWPKSVLLESTSHEARLTFGALLQSAVQCMADSESETDYLDRLENETTETARNSEQAQNLMFTSQESPDDDRYPGNLGGQAVGVVGRFIDLLLNFLSRSHHFWNYDQLLLVILSFAKSSSGKERLFLIERQAIVRLIDFYLGDESPLALQQSPPRAKKTKVDERLTSGSMKPLFDLLELLVTTCETSRNSVPSLERLPPGLKHPVMTRMDFEMATCSSMYSMAMKDDVNATAMGQVAAHLCWENQHVSNVVIDAVICGLDQVNWESFQAYFEVLDRVLGLEDGFPAARAEYTMSKYVKMIHDNRQYKNATTHAIRYLVKLLSKKGPILPHVCRWFISNVDLWVGEWLLRIQFGFVRLEASALIEALLEACQAHYEDSAMVVLQDQIFGLTNAAISIAQKIQDDLQVDQDSFGRFAPLFSAMRVCVRYENSSHTGRGSARLVDNLDKIITLLHLLNSTDLENDESRIEIYRLFLEAMDSPAKSSTELTRHITSNCVFRKAFMSPHLMEDSSTASRRFNLQFLPVFCESLRLMLVKSPAFVQTIDQDVLSTCFTRFVLRSEYADIHATMIRVVLECVKNEEFRRSQIRTCLEFLSRSPPDPDVSQTSTVDWILQYLLHLVSQWHAGPVVVAEQGLAILETCFLEWGAGPNITPENLRGMGLIAVILTKSVRSVGSDCSPLDKPREVVRLSISALSRNKVDACHVADIFQLCLFCCSQSGAVARQAGDFLIEDFLAYAPKSAVSPASESREQMEELSFNEQTKKAEKSVHAPPYIRSEPNVISVIQSIISLYVKAHAEDAIITAKLAQVLMVLLHFSMNYGEQHNQIADVVLHFLSSSSQSVREVSNALRNDPGLNSYPQDVLSQAVPHGELLLQPSLDLILYVCELQQSYKVIEDAFREEHVPEKLLVGIEASFRRLQEISDNNQRENHGSEVSYKKLRSKDSALQVLNGLGAIQLGLRKGGNDRLRQLAVANDLPTLVGPFLPQEPNCLTAGEAKEVERMFSSVKVLLAES